MKSWIGALFAVVLATSALLIALRPESGSDEAIPTPAGVEADRLAEPRTSPNPAGNGDPGGDASTWDKLSSRSGIRTEFTAQFGAEQFVGDPDLGTFSSEQQVRDHIAQTCLDFIPPDWIEQQLLWKTESGHTKRIPFAEIASAIQAFDIEIRFTAGEARALFDVYAMEYSRSAARVAAESEVEAIPQERAVFLSDSAYSCQSEVRTGLWKYPVRFFSKDYPELELRLERLVELRKQRRDLVRQMLP